MLKALCIAAVSATFYCGFQAFMSLNPYPPSFVDHLGDCSRDPAISLDECIALWEAAHE
jgi:hypothetical protein